MSWEMERVTQGQTLAQGWVQSVYLKYSHSQLLPPRSLHPRSATCTLPLSTSKALFSPHYINFHLDKEHECTREKEFPFCLLLASPLFFSPYTQRKETSCDGHLPP